MKIVIEELSGGAEEQVIFKVREMTKDYMRLIALIRANTDALTLYKDAGMYRVSPASVLYFEAVENKVFAYTKDGVYEAKQKLYELEELYRHGDFMRVSKSGILNLKKIRSLTPAFSGRFEAVLENGEKLIISRQYVADLKKRFGL